MARGSFAWRRLTEYHDEARDAFNTPITRNTSNSLDIPAYHDFSPERLRLRLNGSRVSPSEISSQFTDTESHFSLEPDANNRLRIHTGERPRYIVGFDVEASTATRMDSALESGDTVTIGVTDNEDPETCAFFELNADSDNRVVIQDNGTEVQTDTWEFPSDPEIDETTPIRWQILFNWYNVGRYEFSLNFTDNTEDFGNVQQERVVGELSVDDDYATSVGAYHIFSQLDAANAGKILQAGSMAFVVLGDITETSRSKTARRTGLSYGGSGDYEPLLAMQLDQSKRDVYIELTGLDVFPQSGSGELVALVFDADETDASGFSTPPPQSPNSSAIKTTTSVTEFIDQSGTTVTSAADPNGYQVGFDTYNSAGTGTNARIGATGQSVPNRPLYDDDVLLFLFKEDAGNAVDVDITHRTEQSW